MMAILTGVINLMDFMTHLQVITILPSPSCLEAHCHDRKGDMIPALALRNGK
jgi:hypothetical protein